MKKLFKIISLAGIALIVFLAIVLFTFYHLVQIGELRRFLISEIERRTQLRVSVGEAELQMGKVVGISFGDLALMEPDNDRPLITAQKTLIRVALLPLLERKLVFYEIRFYRPTLRVERAEQGTISLSDLLLRLPLQKEGEEQFTLDLRQIRFEKGELIFTDHRGEAGRTVTYLREMDLDIRRIDTKGLLPAAAEGPPDAAAPGNWELGAEFGLDRKSVV